MALNDVIVVVTVILQTLFSDSLVLKDLWIITYAFLRQDKLIKKRSFDDQLKTPNKLWQTTQNCEYWQTNSDYNDANINSSKLPISHFVHETSNNVEDVKNLSMNIKICCSALCRKF